MAVLSAERPAEERRKWSARIMLTSAMSSSG